MNEKAKKLYDGVTNIDDDLIEKAYGYMPGKVHKIPIKKIIAAAACVCICAVASLPVMAATGNDYIYDKLYSFAPGLVQKMKQVNETCVDQGIRLEVVSINVENNKADVLISLKDLEGNRIDKTVDLFDSYSIYTAGNSFNGCRFVDFDESTKTAFFLLEIEQDRKISISNKVTFSLDRILVHKREFTSELQMIELADAKDSLSTFNPGKRGAAFCQEWKNWNYQNQEVIVPSDDEIKICEGVVFTGKGIVDGKLHLQFKYENILDTDNHGFIYLKDKQGKFIECKGSVAFFDDNESDSYEEYIFEIDPNTLDEYIVFGEFTTSSGAIEGDWEITFNVD